jgi:threonine dehydrogenase-like Zn-dependent dehydrogenase
MIRELHLKRAGTLAWAEREPPAVVDPGDAIVRPFLAGRCDGDTLPIHRPVSRAMQLGIAVRAIDPVVACICGKVPFKGPFAIGHEGVAEVVAVGPQVTNVRVGQAVVVPWAVSCGGCARCRQGLTSKCATTTNGPYADHMLVPVPRGVPAERVAAAGDNLADAWRSVVPPLAQRPGGSVLVIGGGAKSIGLYAAGLAVAHGASRVDYLDDDPRRRAVAEAFGARTGARRASERAYDVVAEASSRASSLRRALRALRPGGICTGVGYYVASGTRLPLMRMYATDATLRIGVSHARAILPELLAFVASTGFPAERVTSLTADWDDAPRAYAEKTTKLILRRDRLNAEPF